MPLEEDTAEDSAEELEADLEDDPTHLVVVGMDPQRHQGRASSATKKATSQIHVQIVEADLQI